MRSLLNLLPLILVTLYLCTNRPDKDPKYQLDQCGKNLHTIGVALEKDRLLSEDKLYATKLEEVYGKTPVPECPLGGSQSYVEGYQVGSDRSSYLLVCKGDHHVPASVPPDYPRIAFSVEEAGGSARTTEPEPSIGSKDGPEDEKDEQDKEEKSKLQVSGGEEPKIEDGKEAQVDDKAQVTPTPAPSSTPQPERTPKG